MFTVLFYFMMIVKTRDLYPSVNSFENRPPVTPFVIIIRVSSLRCFAILTATLSICSLDIDSNSCVIRPFRMGTNPALAAFACHSMWALTIWFSSVFRLICLCSASNLSWSGVPLSNQNVTASVGSFMPALSQKIWPILLSFTKTFKIKSTGLAAVTNNTDPSEPFFALCRFCFWTASTFGATTAAALASNFSSCHRFLNNGIALISLGQFCVISTRKVKRRHDSGSAFKSTTGGKTSNQITAANRPRSLSVGEGRRRQTIWDLKIYEHLQRLGVNVNDLRRLNLSLEELKDLVKGLDRLDQRSCRTPFPVDTWCLSACLLWWGVAIHSKFRSFIRKGGRRHILWHAARCCNILQVHPTMRRAEDNTVPACYGSVESTVGRRRYHKEKFIKTAYLSWCKKVFSNFMIILKNWCIMI